MKLAVVLFLLFLLVAATLWAAFIRTWLKNKPWAKPFFDWLEPIELALYKKSETILFARTKVATGVLLAVLTQIGSVDITPLMPLVPSQYQGAVTIAFNLLPLSISIVGFLDEKLRRTTTKPLELVALSNEDLSHPAVAAAVQTAEAVKEDAVSTVQEVQASGTGT